MSKKIVIPILVALLAAILVSIVAVGGVAYAAENGAAQTHRPGRGGVGQITAIGENQFTLQLQRGGELTILVDENTKFVQATGEPAALSDLQVGQWVAGRVKRNDPGELLALRVMILPAGFDPSQVSERHAGTITAVGADTFTLQTRNGQDLTFHVNESTTYLGKVQSLAEIKTGMKALVGANKLEDGTLAAVMVGARPELTRFAGKVTAVDTLAGTFTLHTRQGEDVVIKVDNENTRFRSRNNRVSGLDDLSVGMKTAVRAEKLEDGNYLALVVLAGQK